MPFSPNAKWVVQKPFSPNFWKSAIVVTLFDSVIFSELKLFLGTANNEIPLVPFGAPSILAKTKWIKFSQYSWSPPEIKFYLL